MHNLQKLSNPDYYEAIIQIRPSNKNLLDYIENQVKKKGDVFISKRIVKDYGTDLYLTCRRFALVLARRVKRNFKCEVKSTRTLYTRNRQTSKDVYRVTVLFRFKN